MYDAIQLRILLAKPLDFSVRYCKNHGVHNYKRCDYHNTLPWLDRCPSCEGTPVGCGRDRISQEQESRIRSAVKERQLSNSSRVCFSCVYVTGVRSPIFRGYLSIYYVWIWRLARTDPAYENFSRKKFDNLYKSLYLVHTMKRVNYHLTTKQIEALKQASESTGLSVAEIIRRAIDLWMQKDKNHGD